MHAYLRQSKIYKYIVQIYKDLIFIIHCRSAVVLFGDAGEVTATDKQGEGGMERVRNPLLSSPQVPLKP